MKDHFCNTNLIEASEEEIAAWLSAEEGRPVSVYEVRCIVARALRKLRQICRERGLSPADLVPEW